MCVCMCVCSLSLSLSRPLFPSFLTFLNLSRPLSSTTAPPFPCHDLGRVTRRLEQDATALREHRQATHKVPNACLVPAACFLFCRTHCSKGVHKLRGAVHASQGRQGVRPLYAGKRVQRPLLLAVCLHRRKSKRRGHLAAPQGGKHGCCRGASTTSAQHPHSKTARIQHLSRTLALLTPVAWLACDLCPCLHTAGR